VLLSHLIHTLLLDEVKLLSQELIDSCGGASSSDQGISVREGDCSGVVEEFIVLLVDSLYCP